MSATAPPLTDATGVETVKIIAPLDRGRNLALDLGGRLDGLAKLTLN
jgi:hypothetical protein